MSLVRLFIDFDGIYKRQIPDKNTIVLTNMYNSDYVININAYAKDRKAIFTEFERSLENVSDVFTEYYDLISLRMYFFTSFYYPLGQWISTIDSLIEKGRINEDTQVVFSSYSNNRLAFVFEAEGESNGQFLYKKSYFLSYYLKCYLQLKGFSEISTLHERGSAVKMSFLLRGSIVLFIKVTQLLIYKLFTFQRGNRLSYSGDEKGLVAISSRGIVQTQLIGNIFQGLKNSSLLIVNESSSKPFRNYKVAKKLGGFYYAEGNISLKELGSEIMKVIKCYFSIRKVCVRKFFGIEINLFHLLPECSVKLFHIKTYALSVKNSVNYLEKRMGFRFRKTVSMEMLPPFSYFLKQYIGGNVIQIQTTAMTVAEYPDFVYSDKFYFNDRGLYNAFVALEPERAETFAVLPNIKYLGTHKVLKKYDFKIVTYFTQPIYLDEENKLIMFLKKLCNYMGLQLRIKLHPRSAIPQIDLLGIEIIDGILDSRTVVKTSDIVVTRNSSVGMDCWFLNVPVLFFVNGTLNGDNINYIPKDYLGVIQSEPKVEVLSQMLPSIIECFYEHPYHSEFFVDEELLNNEILA